MRDTREKERLEASLHQKYRRLFEPIAKLCRDIWHTATSFVSL